MTVQQFLQDASATLGQAGIQTARLDCLVLLEDVLGNNRAHILAHPELLVTPTQLSRLNTFIAQREQHIPLAYIRGRIEFYGRDFVVNTDVLVPRPETEVIITLLKNIHLPARAKIADVGTGSGCIGITAALELPGQADVFLYDIDPAALAVAVQNAQAYNAHVHTAQQDLLQNCAEQFDAVLANLPYVPDEYPINHAASFEPEHALFAGADGLGLYRTFWVQIAALPHKPSHILTESLPSQHTALTKLAQAAGYRQIAAQNFIQHFAPITRS